MALEIRGFATLDAAGWHAGLRKIRDSSTDAARELKNIVMSGVGILTVEEAIRKTAERAEELVIGSHAINATVEEFQVMQRAAQLVGASMDHLAMSFARMNAARGMVIARSGEWKKALEGFEKLGVSEATLRGPKRMYELFTGPMSNKLKQVGPEEMALAFRDIGLRGFAHLIPLLQRDFGKIAEEMHGKMMTSEAAVGLKHFKDQLTLVGWFLVNKLAPTLVEFGFGVMKVTHWITQVVDSLKWGKQEVAAWADRRTIEQAWLPALQKIVKSPHSAETADMIQRMNASVFGPTRGAVSRRILGGGDIPQLRTPKDAEEWTKRLEDLLSDKRSESERSASEFLERRNNEEEKYLKDVEELRKRFHEEGTHAKPFNEEELADMTAGQKRPARNADALVRVGNFLGSSGAEMQRLAKRQVDLLLQIRDRMPKAWPTQGVDAAPNGRFPVV